MLVDAYFYSNVVNSPECCSKVAVTCCLENHLTVVLLMYFASLNYSVVHFIRSQYIEYLELLFSGQLMQLTFFANPIEITCKQSQISGSENNCKTFIFV